MAAVAATAPAAPVPILLRDTVYVDRVILAWEPAVDPDGDVQRSAVRWWLDGVDAALATEFHTGEHHADLDGDVAVGDVVHWQVAAEDTWGVGAWSDVQSLTVIEKPAAVVDAGDEAQEPAAEPAACATGPGAFSVLGVIAVATALVRRRAGK